MMGLVGNTLISSIINAFPIPKKKLNEKINSLSRKNKFIHM